MKRKRAHSEVDEATPAPVERLLKRIHRMTDVQKVLPISTPSKYQSRNRGSSQCGLLMGLPVELRLRIFEYALGGDLVHIDCLTPFAQSRLIKKQLYSGGSNGFYNEVCSLQSPTDRLHERFADKANDLKWKTPLYNPRTQQDLGRGYYVEAWSTQHLSCCDGNSGPRSDLSRWETAERLFLPLLRTCKQIYHEARLLPYSANTFVFNSARCFQEFAMLRRFEELKAINHLNLVVSIGTAPFSGARSRDWVHALHFGDTSRFLHSLKSLDICVELYDRSILDSRTGYAKTRFKDLMETVQTPYPQLSETSWIEQMAALCHKQPCRVRVVVADDPLSSWGCTGKRQYCRDLGIRDEEWCARREQMCLTLDEKRAFAGRLTKLLKLRPHDVRKELYEEPHVHEESETGSDHPPVAAEG